jgi:hypothetical protein
MRRLRVRLALTFPLLALGCRVSGPRIEATRPPSPRVFAVVAAPAEPVIPAAQVFVVADGTCHSLTAIDSLERSPSPDSVVRAILRSPALAALPLAETHVRVTESTALVDLRMRPGSRRTLRELSLCESLALLGGIRLTLQANPRWGIQRVIFTERGSLFAI